MGNKKSLVIVESPTKAKTINKYLGESFTVKSSMGHLIDLPKSRLAVDIQKGFQPDYITIRGRGKILSELRKEAGKCERVYLAADSDREGEAISFHIKNALEKGRANLEIKRVVFNEITRDAIEEAVKNPRDIDLDLVNAQKARRILDRLVGYNLSPLLWEKIKKGLSAGRVQSVALRIICEREEEIERFVPKEYWSIEADFKKEAKKFTAKLFRFNGEKVEIGSEAQANGILGSVAESDFVVKEIEEKKRSRRAPPPFTTSKLQQAAGVRLGFVSGKTMLVAQQLYEGIGLSEGPVGLITYMRTDSVRVSQQAQAEAKKFIIERFSEKYVPEKPNLFKVKSGAQDAHEAIRPTSVFRTPETVKEFLSRDQYRLYTLIWEQFVASQMAEAVFKQVRVDIEADGGLFRVTGQQLLFNGFLKLLKAEEEDRERALPRLQTGEILKPLEVRKEVHFTEPPPRYNDATLVKFLEESGIGRPSTYAPIITTLLTRYYVERKNRQFIPTFLGRLTNQLLTKNFPGLLDIGFTSNMEEKLDEIAEGKLEWSKLLEEFYFPFIVTVESAKKNLESYKGITDEATDLVCEKCGRMMMKKLGKFGYFLACSGFPDCRSTMPVPLGRCPKPGCEGFVVERKTRKRGRRSFYGCSRYPECDFMTWDKPVEKSCSVCGGVMVLKTIDGQKYLVCLREGCEHREPAGSGPGGQGDAEKVLIPAEK
jgi:DNA topoisomerase-1